MLPLTSRFNYKLFGPEQNLHMHAAIINNLHLFLNLRNEYILKAQKDTIQANNLHILQYIITSSLTKQSSFLQNCTFDILHNTSQQSIHLQL